MPISPSQFIKEISDKITQISQKTKTEKFEGKNIQVPELTDLEGVLPKLATDLQDLLNELSAQAETDATINEKTYIDAIKKIVALTYVKEYIKGRTRVWKVLKWGTQKTDLLKALEEIIANPFSPQKFPKTTNFLLPSIGNDSFETAYLASIDDPDVVKEIFRQMLISFNAASQWRGGVTDDGKTVTKNVDLFEKHLNYCVNVNKVIARLSVNTYGQWNELVTKKLSPQAVSALGVFTGGKGNELQQMKETEIRDKLSNLFLNNLPLVASVKSALEVEHAAIVAELSAKQKAKKDLSEFKENNDEKSPVVTATSSDMPKTSSAEIMRSISPTAAASRTNDQMTVPSSLVIIKTPEQLSKTKSPTPAQTAVASTATSPTKAYTAVPAAPPATVPVAPALTIALPLPTAKIEPEIPMAPPVEEFKAGETASDVPDAPPPAPPLSDKQIDAAHNAAYFNSPKREVPALAEAKAAPTDLLAAIQKGIKLKKPDTSATSPTATQAASSTKSKAPATLSFADSLAAKFKSSKSNANEVNADDWSPKNTSTI
jgi:hypothetical protein